jgi:hypothetical protein
MSTHRIDLSNSIAETLEMSLTPKPPSSNDMIREDKQHLKPDEFEVRREAFFGK